MAEVSEELGWAVSEEVLTISQLVDESARTTRFILGLSIKMDLISGFAPEMRLIISTEILVFFMAQRVSFSNFSTPITLISGTDTDRLGNDLNRFRLMSENSTLALRLLLASCLRRFKI